MREAKLFGRLITAVVTPFDESGEVDYRRFADLVDFQYSNGVDSLCVCGTTGESPTLTAEEKLALFAQSVLLSRGRGGVIANIGSNNTAASVSFAREAAALGVDGVMAVVPYYNKPSQEGMFQHFKAIAEAVPRTTVVIYNIPGRSVVGLEAPTMLRLMQACPNVRAMKEAAIDPEMDHEVLASAPEGFEMFSGNDDKTLDMMGYGVSGVISTTSNVAPAQMAEMVDSFAAGDVAAARAAHDRLDPLMKGLFRAPNPTLVKEALRLAGRPVGGLRLPLVQASAQESDFIRGVMLGCGVEVKA